MTPEQRKQLQEVLREAQRLERAIGNLETDLHDLANAEKIVITCTKQFTPGVNIQFIGANGQASDCWCELGWAHYINDLENELKEYKQDLEQQYADLDHDSNLQGGGGQSEEALKQGR